MSTYELMAWDDGGVRVVRVTGEFDISAYEAFQVEVAVGPSDLMVIDMRHVTFLDSHALGALIGLQNRAQAEGFGLAMIRPEGYADRIFKITGMDGYLPLYDERVPILAHMNYG